MHVWMYLVDLFCVCMLCVCYTTHKRVYLTRLEVVVAGPINASIKVHAYY